MHTYIHMYMYKHTYIHTSSKQSEEKEHILVASLNTMGIRKLSVAFLPLYGVQGIALSVSVVFCVQWCSVLGTVLSVHVLGIVLPGMVF